MDSQEVIDLEEIVKDRAWNFYKRIRKFWQPKHLDDVNIIFDWSGVSFVPDETKFDEKEIGPELKPEQHVTIFKSVFENKSEREQMHSLKAERQTVAICKSSLTKGFTKGRNVGLTLQAPQNIVTASVGYSKGFTVTSVEESTDQKTLTWTIEGSLTVAPNSELTAEVHIKEKRCKYDFTTRVAIRGKVVAKIYDLQNKFLIAYTGDMNTILAKLSDKLQHMNLKIDGETVFLDIAGQSKFNFGTQQETIISECAKK